MTKLAYSIAISVFLLVAPLESVKGEDHIKAQIFKMPETPEVAAVTTAGHYILVSHLVRSLTKLDRLGKIQSDIATRWSHSPDHKTWTLKIGEAKFSNGEEIKPKDVVDSVLRQMKFKTGVHFPFSEIESIVAIDSSTVKIKLQSPRNEFIYDLSKPEFGVLHHSDSNAEKNKLSFKISSGPYSLESSREQTFKLKRNKFFLADVQNQLDLEISSANSFQIIDRIQDSTIDFFTTQQNLTPTEHFRATKLSNVTTVKPHIAFSYWISLNPKSKYFSTKKNRHALQKYVRGFFSDEMKGQSWEKADQLYLPDGEGRPSQSELQNVWNKIEQDAVELKKQNIKPRLRIVPLKMSNQLIEDLLKYLESRYAIEVIHYKTEEELVSILKGNEFEAKISSNDFSSIDLTENIKTTFNASRPYVFLEDRNEIAGMLSQISQTEDAKKKSKLCKEIGITLLSDGLIAPLAYQRVWFYHNSRLDIRSWSSIYPEISFWKVKIHDRTN